MDNKHIMKGFYETLAGQMDKIAEQLYSGMPKQTTAKNPADPASPGKQFKVGPSKEVAAERRQRNYEFVQRDPEVPFYRAKAVDQTRKMKEGG